MIVMKGETMQMKYELSTDESQLIEEYRNLNPEFKAALKKQMKVLYDLQIVLVAEWSAME